MATLLIHGLQYSNKNNYMHYEMFTRYSSSKIICVKCLTFPSDLRCRLSQLVLLQLILFLLCYLRGGADKSLARPGRKQSTATKLGIYSTYSSRSSIHFLARCSKFCMPLKKKFITLSVQPGLRGSNDLRAGRKMANFLLFFQSTEQVVVRLGQIRIIGCVIR
jgi:hypothetical protein